MNMELSDLKDSIGFYFGHTSRALMNAIHKAFHEKGYDITPQQWHILMFLWYRDGQTQQQITNETNKEKTTTARIIEGLLKRGLIKKEQDRSDKRNKLIYLTDDGRDLKKKLIPIAQEVINRAINGLTDEEISILKLLMKRVYENLKTS